MHLKTMRYMHNLHTSLDDVRLGEKVLLAYRPDPTVTIRVKNGVVAAINATAIRIAWEGQRPYTTRHVYRRSTVLPCL